MEKDAYFIQQWALCTYKDKTTSPQVALTDALAIINRLNPTDRNTVDPETLGLTGAIYKRLWELTPDNVEYLDRAVDFYKRGFTINQDYYTGENYALCLNLKGKISEDPEEKVYFKIEAKKTRKEIVDIIEKLKEDEDFGIRSDLSWIYATLAHCHYALGDTKLHQSYDEKFKSLEPLEWQLDTYNKSLQLLIEIL